MSRLLVCGKNISVRTAGKRSEVGTASVYSKMREKFKMSQDKGGEERNEMALASSTKVRSFKVSQTKGKECKRSGTTRHDLGNKTSTMRSQKF